MSGVEQYLTELSEAVTRLSRQDIERVVALLFDAWQRDATIFIFGNGGSSATASHMANDLNKQVSAGGCRRLRALALTDNVPLLTAWANDASYHHVFVEQMLNFLKPGDVALGISTSGESPNVVEAIRTARSHGASTIGLTGRAGGTLASLVDCCVFATSDDIGQQEDIHLILNHVITAALRRRILEASGPPQ